MAEGDEGILWSKEEEEVGYRSRRPMSRGRGLEKGGNLCDSTCGVLTKRGVGWRWCWYGDPLYICLDTTVHPPVISTVIPHSLLLLLLLLLSLEHSSGTVFALYPLKVARLASDAGEAVAKS